MKKGIIIVAILVIIAVLITGIFFWSKSNKPQNNIVSETKSIVVFSPKENEVVASPLKITGAVYGNGWSGFEGQVGTVDLVGTNGTILASGILTAQGEWTTLPINFETSLNFTDPVQGVALLIFHNENPSGDTDKSKIFIMKVKSNSGVEYQYNYNNRGK